MNRVREKPSVQLEEVESNPLGESEIQTVAKILSRWIHSLDGASHDDPSDYSNHNYFPNDRETACQG